MLSGGRYNPKLRPHAFKTPWILKRSKPYQGSAILSESVRNRDTGEPGISISIDFWKFSVPVSVSESIITKIWYPTQWFWAFHQNLCYKTCLTLVSVSESESIFSLFLVWESESTRRRTSLSIGIGIEKAGIAGSWCAEIIHFPYWIDCTLSRSTPWAPYFYFKEQCWVNISYDTRHQPTVHWLPRKMRIMARSPKVTKRSFFFFFGETTCT